MSTISLSQSMIARRLTWVITHMVLAGVPSAVPTYPARRARSASSCLAPMIACG
ncbi:MAG TPA: hypothetical protein VF914_09245 [Chloroflexia bacterium]|jgi:hypothetical protein